MSSLKDAQANGFVATIKENAESRMGILHAAYGESRIVSLKYGPDTYVISDVNALRSRRFLLTTGCDPICSAQTLVIPFSRVTRDRMRQ